MTFNKIPGFRAFIKKNVHQRNNKELAELVNAEFNLDLTIRQIKTYKSNHGFSSGMGNQHRKGCVPPNAIKKGQHIGPQTEYKKGNVPFNTLPIGSEVLREDGYVWVKVNENPGPQNIAKRWKPRAYINYEKVHGSVPEGHVLLRLDGDKLNDNIENLMAVTKGLVAVMNKHKLIFNNPEATKSGVIIAQALASAAKVKQKRGVSNAKKHIDGS